MTLSTIVRFITLLFIILLILSVSVVHQPLLAQLAQTQTVYVLKPGKVFDGVSGQLHDGWVIVVRGDKIDAAGPPSSTRQTTASARPSSAH